MWKMTLRSGQPLSSINLLTLSFGDGSGKAGDGKNDVASDSD